MSENQFLGVTRIVLILLFCYHKLQTLPTRQILCLQHLTQLVILQNYTSPIPTKREDIFRI